MWFGEPHPFPERGPPTRLSGVGTVRLKRKSGKILYLHTYNFIQPIPSWEADSPLYTSEIFPFVWNTNLWSPYAQQRAAGPFSGPEKSNPNFYFCKIQGIGIYDNANVNTVYQSSIKNPVSIPQKTPSLHYKVELILHEEVQDVWER
jgi:hypothetical protein